jgi:glycosyltransferase involved in cell wall biosynthesis
VTTKPAVTVVIPTRNRWTLFSSTALRAALDQEEVEHEIVVVDDGSTDETSMRLAELAGPRVRVVHHERPQGVARARNRGIREARGEWIAFLDDDDIWSTRKLRLQLDAARAVRAGFVYTGAVWIDHEFRLVQGHAPPNPATLAPSLLRSNVLWGGSSNVLARTDFLRALGGFDERLSQLADWDLWIRLALAGSAAALDDVLVALLMHRESMLLVDRRDVFAEFGYLEAKHRKTARQFGVRPDAASFARWVAGGHLRAGRRLAAARAYVRGTASPGNLARALGALVSPSLLASASSLRTVVPGALPEVQRVAERPAWLDRYR